jgi:4-deoxy-L-threo-5-hexosulose-uronate ketol-isomerase
VKIHMMADSTRYQRMTGPELRDAFVLDHLAVPGEIRLAYAMADRAVVGMATPLEERLTLTADPELRASYFLERRELGVVNIGGSGCVLVDGKASSLENLDGLYIGRGNRLVEFHSADAKNPAVYYLLSYPAHREFPTTIICKNQANPTELGSAENANHRVVCKYIHMQGANSCQLVMGVTHLQTGSVWNTMPPHTHMRRSEIYMYFNLTKDDRVIHLMGPPDDTRHVVLGNREVVVSPGWSIHAGAGTHAYSFCWGMGGENQDYADMDPVEIGDLR